MKMKTVISGILSAAVSISMLTACSANNRQNEQTGVNNQSEQSLKSEQNSNDKTSKSEDTGIHTLYIRNADKNSEMTASFYNSMTGKSENIQMEKIGDTDIYRIVIPVGANRIIFNTGISNEEIANGAEAYQTSDLVFDENINAGQVYKIDMTKAAKHGRGVEKTKYTYPAGEWSDYTP